MSTPPERPPSRPHAVVDRRRRGGRHGHAGRDPVADQRRTRRRTRRRVPGCAHLVRRGTRRALGRHARLAPRSTSASALALQAVRERRIPWWYLVGGAGGAFLVLTQTLTVALLGVALFTVATVSGQTISGLLIDRRGMGSDGAQAAHRVPDRRLGTRARRRRVWRSRPSCAATCRSGRSCCPFLAGIAIGWQQAVNGQVRDRRVVRPDGDLRQLPRGHRRCSRVATLIHSVFVGWPEDVPDRAVALHRRIHRRHLHRRGRGHREDHRCAAAGPRDGRRVSS